jgi:hypothetical protein
MKPISAGNGRPIAPEKAEQGCNGWESASAAAGYNTKFQFLWHRCAILCENNFRYNVRLPSIRLSKGANHEKQVAVCRTLGKARRQICRRYCCRQALPGGAIRWTYSWATEMEPFNRPWPTTPVALTQIRFSDIFPATISRRATVDAPSSTFIKCPPAGKLISVAPSSIASTLSVLYPALFSSQVVASKALTSRESRSSFLQSEKVER